MYLKGKLVTLRSIEREDIEIIRDGINNPDMEKSIVGWAYPISKKDQEKWFESYSPSDRMLRFVIETETDGVVGLTGLRDIDWKNGTADNAGIRIFNKELHGRGLATDAQFTLYRYAFEELRLNRISGKLLEENKASLRMDEKIGFKVEGIQREAIFKNGVYHNVYLMGLLKSDYEQIVRDKKYWD